MRDGGRWRAKNSRGGYAGLLVAAGAGHAEAGEVAAELERQLTPERLDKATAQAGRFEPVADPPFADPATVMYLQHALNGLGFEAGPVDGILGNGSRAAISNYQKSRGLPVSGQATPELVQQLFEEQNPGA